MKHNEFFLSEDGERIGMESTVWSPCIPRFPFQLNRKSVKFNSCHCAESGRDDDYYHDMNGGRHLDTRHPGPRMNDLIKIEF